ncbi:MAG: oligosaccharide flippase family protein [Verrucomicrobiota bacterium]
MSRFKRFAHSLLSGYLLVGVTAVYSLITFPLGLHFLSKAEFGLWNAVMNVASLNLILIDLGMSGSISRILIDHKDEKNSSNYGTVILTGLLVLCVQAVLIAALGSLLSFWSPGWMKIPEKFWPIFRTLMISQCIVLGTGYVGRIFGFILQAHQRYDICNYLSAGGLAINFLTLWISFKLGFGLYSLLIGSISNAVFNIIFSALAVLRFRLLPEKGYWGRPKRAVFRELFFYGSDLFLISIAQQLISFSAVPVITRTMGLEAVTIWSGAIKVFMLAQQLVYRIADFSMGALAEMLVRGEQERIKKRFRDIVILTGATAAGAVALALCNQSFLTIWTSGKISWNPANDLLMAFSFFVYAITRLSIVMVGLTKQIGAMKYIYFIEGAAFVGLSLLWGRVWGFQGIIWSGIVSNLLFSGIYGARRVTEYFQIRYGELLGSWLNRPIILFLVAGISAFAFWVATQSLTAPWRLAINASSFGTILLFLFWRIGLPQHLRKEMTDRLQRKINQ